MPKYVIIAIDVPPGQPRYFSGFQDRGGTTETVWTLDLWKALRINADEAMVEAMLLCELCPSRRLIVQSLSMA
jgi:hypothetical protein